MPESDATPARCELCGGELRDAFTTTDRNRALSQMAFPYMCCMSCATYAIREVPSDLARYYPPEYYGGDDLAALEQAASSTPEQAKLDLIRAHATTGHLVEIGPGWGQFTLAAHTAGFDVTAIEMDGRACERLERLVGVRAIQSAEPESVLRELPQADVIAMWHVLEHLPHPALTLTRIAESLRPGGILALAVPNPQSLQFRLLRGRWAHVDAPRHLFLIPLAALVDHAAMHGMELASVTTADLAGRYWNRFGWEYALRRFPAVHPGNPLTRSLAAAIALSLSPVERRGLGGTTYTAVFVKSR